MDSACVYDQKTVIQELTQGIEMAKRLRVNLNSAEARDFFINKILSSYQNALFLLKSAEYFEQLQATALPAPSLPDSTISIGSPESTEFEFDQFDQSFFGHQDHDVVSKKRKEMTAWDNQLNMYIDNDINIPYNRNDAKLATLPPLPPLPKKHKTRSTNHQHHELSPPNIRDNIRVHASQFGANDPSSASFLAASFGLMEDNQQQLHNNNLNYFEDELLQVYSPPFISPDSLESNYFSGWESSSSQESVDVQADLNHDFIFNNSFLEQFSV
ncbi:uncharacterized protein [Rutidosis leptorrhynchoides]|uniref:uncharacterized protein n=1 Tax=Rutidosis leptorrhynchoides TaxID=125765 RepID=UPI003A9A01BB